MRLSRAERTIIALAVLAAVFTLGFFAGRSGGSSFVVQTQEQVSQESTDAEQTTASAAESDASPAQEIISESKVNINTADSALLQTLPGIGDTLAGRIIAYREENGNFTIIDEITDVNGLGDKLFENLQDLITVD